MNCPKSGPQSAAGRSHWRATENCPHPPRLFWNWVDACLGCPSLSSARQTATGWGRGIRRSAAWRLLHSQPTLIPVSRLNLQRAVQRHFFTRIHGLPGGIERCRVTSIFWRQAVLEVWRRGNSFRRGQALQLDFSSARDMAQNGGAGVRPWSTQGRSPPCRA